MMRWVMIGLVVFVIQTAAGSMVISEWMYNGAGDGSKGEYIEFTNIGPSAVDMTGWSFDDASAAAGTISLSGFGVVNPGQSVILTDETAADFATFWNLSGVSIIGGNTANLGRDDGIYLFDPNSAVVDSLLYGDETGYYPGTVRTNKVSCNIPATDYDYAVVQTSWVLATVGDVYGSWASSRAEIGSPGIVPEPAAAALAVLGAAMIIRRRG